jgi:Ca2+-binding EF-hand superfamily protein
MRTVLIEILGTLGLLTLGADQGLAQSLSDKYAADIDSNKDGAISRAEYAAMARSHFERYDLNKDGRLEGVERPRYMSREGSTTAAQYLVTSLEVFDSEDTNHDGSIAGEEVKRFWDHLND